jgi:hypothetical protein
VEVPADLPAVVEQCCSVMISRQQFCGSKWKTDNEATPDSRVSSRRSDSDIGCVWRTQGECAESLDETVHIHFLGSEAPIILFCLSSTGLIARFRVLDAS